MDAHQNEYDAAAAGMADVYGRTAPAVGDFVNGITAGRFWGGYVLEIRGDRLAVDVDGAIVEAPLSDLTTR
jgi:hypothetical protein